MTYNADLTWEDLSKLARQSTNQLIVALNNTLEARDNWNSFRDARSDATIATALTRAEAEIADMRVCFVGMKEVHDFCNNVASPTQGDRFGDWRKFT